MILPGNMQNNLPKIVYDEMKGSIKIYGRSTSDDVESYFSDFIPYLKDNLEKDPMDVDCVFDFEFFNTKSARLIMKIMYILKKHVHDVGKKLTITWTYEEDDEDLLDCGKDYESILSIPFKFVEKSV